MDRSNETPSQGPRDNLMRINEGIPNSESFLSPTRTGNDVGEGQSAPERRSRVFGDSITGTTMPIPGQRGALPQGPSRGGQEGLTLAGPAASPSAPEAKPFAELVQGRTVKRFNQLHAKVLEKQGVALSKRGGTQDPEIAAAVEQWSSALDELDAAWAEVRAEREASGISGELWKHWERFSESLGPAAAATAYSHGGYGGDGERCWVVECAGDHGGSYADFDPALRLFLDSLEVPLERYNFEAHAFTTARPEWDADLETFVYPTRYMVAFCTVKAPKSLIGEKTNTWREKYPVLYGLVDEAIAAGSNAAVEMLQALPAADEPFRGGWLFNYAPDSSARNTMHHPPRHFAFRSAHKIKSVIGVAL